MGAHGDDDDEYDDEHDVKNNDRYEDKPFATLDHGGAYEAVRGVVVSKRRGFVATMGGNKLLTWRP